MASTLTYSQHNIYAQTRHGKRWFLINLLSGEADWIDDSLGLLLESKQLPTGEVLDQWLHKGYVVEPEAERKKFQQGYLDFLDQRDHDEVQVFFAPWYTCNFSCSYCFQDSYGWEPQPLAEGIVEAFFDWTRQELKGRSYYVTVFGGEPLLPGVRAKEIMMDFIQKSVEHGVDLAFVTNGYHLKEYLDIIPPQHCREIQVTLDGPAENHNTRRKLRGGGETFERIVEGIDLALAQGFTINLRMVVDRQNLHSLPELARFAKARGWTDHPHFKTQLGRNYELHSCQQSSGNLYSRVELAEELDEIIKKYPEVLDFHRPAFSIARFLFDEGQLPAPLYDSCTGTKTEWALDGQGHIYSCTATVGKPGEELGTYWPQKTLQSSIIEQWQDRDIVSISKCQTCHVRLACGGGCTSVAKNQADGEILSPDCRPVQQLLQIGLDVYQP